MRVDEHNLLNILNLPIINNVQKKKRTMAQV